MTGLYFSPLVDALLQLDEGLRQAEDHPDNELLRDGVIHRFVSSHRLSVRFIRKTLESMSDKKNGRMTSYDILRAAAAHGLITNLEGWFEYRIACNKTTHTRDTATAVYASARPFLTDARELLVRVTDLNNSASAE